MPATTSPPTNPRGREDPPHRPRRRRAGPQGFPLHGGYSFRTGWYGGRRIGEGEIRTGNGRGRCSPRRRRRLLLPTPGRHRGGGAPVRRPRKEPAPQQLEPAGRLFGEHHAGDEVFAARHLRVVRRRAGQDGSVREIHERGGQGARPRSSATPSGAPPEAARDSGWNGSSPRGPFRRGTPRGGRVGSREGSSRKRRLRREASAREADPAAISARVSVPGPRRRWSRRSPRPGIFRTGFPAARREERDTAAQGVGKERFPGTQGTSIPSGRKRIVPARQPCTGRKAAGGRRRRYDGRADDSCGPTRTRHPDSSSIRPERRATCREG